MFNRNIWFSSEVWIGHASVSFKVPEKAIIASYWIVFAMTIAIVINEPELSWFTRARFLLATAGNCVEKLFSSAKR